ncbi:aspartyl-tRNA synthetase [Naematelia encephala]|uniref:Probable aspartate--tRNA ligase, cytoplasmic n=1 Tax=Naematelia encephala TaxID=71784 RepID=A0A1Y2BBB5_9TREE|nr:aspartyl-tRNA synthetase [Naematelia encephala]
MSNHTTDPPEKPQPHGLSKITQALKSKLSKGSSNGTDNPTSDGITTGKAQQRSEQRRHEKEEKAQRLQEGRQSLEEQRELEAQQAKREEDPETQARYGDLRHPSVLVTVEEIEGMREGEEVTFRARIHAQRKVSAALDFLLFRQQEHLIQGVLSRTSPHMVKWTQRLHPESIVQVSGKLQRPKDPVHSATIHELEVAIYSIHLVTSATDIPFDLYHRYDSEPLHKRLQSRIVDLRHPANHAVFRVRSKIMQVFRQTMEDEGFLEISTPKLQPAATESGAEVFKVNYFGRTAFLAQSPQLAKQMAISADMGKVFEIGPVFRAENSNTHRHLTEYTGLDIEMAIEQDYHEVMRVLCKMLKNVFAAVQSMRTELDRVRERWPSDDLVWLDETPVIPFNEGIQMLRDDGREVEYEDLSTRDEIRLGELVKEKYKTDFYVLDKFPISARPFYTMNDGTATNSFDMFIRGQEVCTGGQRINDPKALREAMQKGGIDEGGMEEYLEAFDWGVPPHGGAGLGLERIVFLMLNLGNVRYASLFHRDPKSLPVKPPTIPHPESSTLRHHKEPQPLEELIANYGDATNTSWLDDRFQVWRQPGTGAAIGFVPQKKFAMVAGDPLCEATQYGEVIMAFLEFVRTELKLTPIWMLVSDEVQEILARRLGWRTMTCVEEQRADADGLTGREDGKEARRIDREGVEVSQVQPDEEVRRRVDERIEEWKASRQQKGKQVHLTEIAPWKDSVHRRYFTAEKNGRVEAFVVLAQLSPRHGWQVKWAMDFPNSTSGAIEVTVARALQTLSGAVTFGAGVSDRLVPTAHLNGMRARFLAKSYAAVVSSLNLKSKADFRDKFGTYGESVFICYPKNGLGPQDVNEIVKFFED